MSMKKQPTGLGRSLIRHRERRLVASDRHTSEMGGSTVTSITENTSVEEFLSNAEASQRSFEAERGKFKVVHEDELSEEEEGEMSGNESEEDDKDEEFFSVPRKPDWKECPTPEEYVQKEKLQFLAWKRMLSKQQKKYPNLPPFEKNLDFWRQFWKMVELSEVVVQVVDARDPLFYFSQDLCQYVKEVSAHKINVLLLNKADYLTKEQREKWAEYFSNSDVDTMFFSAVDEDEMDEENEDTLAVNTSRILSPSQVLKTLQKIRPVAPLTVGFLGYPNVGKSSTINRFLTNKKLQVSATPGKTKHYQTHVLKGEVTLVDGPGLVIPNLNMTKADMVLAGILPIDNLTDFMPSMDLLLTKISFQYIQKNYGIAASCVTEARRNDRKSKSMQILSSLALMRGFMKPGGIPDQFRAARIIFKDYVQGKLLFCKAPPNIDQDDFFKVIEVENVDEEEDLSLENSFPELRLQSQVHVRGAQANMKKGGKKHGNSKKREKARRLYKDPYDM